MKTFCLVLIASLAIVASAHLRHAKNGQTQFFTITQSITVNAGSTKTFSNPAPFSVTAQCTVSDGSIDQLCGELTSGSGQLNGTSFVAGQQQCYSLSNGEQLTVEASGSAEIDFQNNGQTSVTLTCKANIELLQQTQFISEDIVLAPGQSKSLQNPLPITVSGNCAVSTSGSDSVQASISQGSATVNGQSLSSGQSGTYDVSNGESLQFSADGSTSITFTNTGSNQVTFDCSVDLLDRPIFKVTEKKSLKKQSNLLISETINLAPGQSKSLSNPLPFSVSGSCSVSTKSSDQVSASISSGSATLNGKSYNSGDSATLTVTNGENLQFTAGGSVSISFENVGSDSVTFNCNVDAQSVEHHHQRRKHDKKLLEFISETIQITPGESKSFSNPVGISVSGSCSVSTKGSNVIDVTITGGSASLNGKQYSSGNSAALTATNGENFSFQASGNAGLNFHNTGSNTVTLDCSVNLDTKQRHHKQLLEFISETLKITAGESKSFTNPLGFTVSGSCSVSTTGSNTIDATITAGSAQLNGTTYNKGASADLTATNGESFTFSAAGNAGISFHNTGSNEVDLDCSINLKETLANRRQQRRQQRHQRQQNRKNNNNQLVQFISQTINIAAGQSQSLSNPLPITVSGSCTVSTSGSQPVSATVNSGSAQLNGQSYSQGQSLSLNLSSGQQLTFSAAGNASIEFTDDGSQTVSLNCNVSLGDEIVATQ